MNIMPRISGNIFKINTTYNNIYKESENAFPDECN